MFAWLQSHEVLLGWLSVASAVMFFGSLIAVPWLVVHLPTDYFLRQRHYADRWKPRHPLLRVAFLGLKNVTGVVLILAGVAMLVLPGQGILTILVGMLFVDFPGKFALERRVARQPPVFRALNWIRKKALRPPLEAPPREGGHS
ncbi:MAG: PGPGW domain-containing protein [Thermoguttaceae bacterium]